MAENLVNALADLKEQEAIKIVKNRLGAGEDPLKILGDARKGMEIVGNRFASSEYFIPDLVYSGEILKSVTELVKPGLTTTGESKKLGKIVFGTVAGDIHDIGKDIVVFMLDVNGFEVHDLGRDVPLEKFVEEQQRTNADIVALSALMTTSMLAMPKVIEMIKAKDSNVAVMVGGAPLTREIANSYGADGYAHDAVSAVQEAARVLGSLR